MSKLEKRTDPLAALVEESRKRKREARVRTTQSPANNQVMAGPVVVDGSRTSPAFGTVARRDAGQDPLRQLIEKSRTLKERRPTGSGNAAKPEESITQKIRSSVREELRGETGWRKQLQDQAAFNAYRQYKDYAEIPRAADFEEKRRYIERKTDREMDVLATLLTSLVDDQAPIVWKSSGWEDPFYAWINGDKEAGAYLKSQDNTYGAEGGALGRIMDSATGGMPETAQLSEEEVGIFNYLYATAPEDAYRYYEFLQSDLYRRAREDEEARAAAYAAEDPVGASAFSILESPLKGLSYAAQLGEYIGGGSINENAPHNKFSYIPTAIRGQVSRDIEANVAGFWGKAGSFAYQTGMSMGDFLLNTGITGGNQAVSLAIMGTGAAADATIDAKDRGLADDQAFLLGTIAGAAEVVTEKISLEALLKPDWEKGVLNYVIKNALAEGSEEVGSDAINLVADVLISKNKSEWAQSIQAYMAQGYSEGEATGLAVRDQAMTMGLDFLGGALSGGVISGVAGAGQVLTKYESGRKFNTMDLSAEDIQAFIDEGLASDPDTQAYKLAAAAQQKLAAGGTLTNYELGNLYQANVRAISAEDDSIALLQEAAQDAAEGKRITNRVAQGIVDSPSALRALAEEVGLSISDDMSRSQRREAVRNALNGLARPAVDVTAARETSTTPMPQQAEAGPEMRREEQTVQARPSAPVQQVWNDRRLDAALETLGPQGKAQGKAFFDSATQDPVIYYGGWAAYYEAGVSGMDMGKVQAQYANALNGAQKQAAYLAGQADAAASLRAEQERIPTATVYGAEAGFIQNDQAVKLPRSTVIYYNNLARAAGVKIQMAPATGSSGANGWYAHGIINIAEDAEDPGIVVATHEVTHRMQEMAPKEYRAYRDYAMQALGAEGGTHALVEAYKARYARAGQNLTTEQAMDEIAADFTGDLLRNVEGFKDLANTHRSVARKLLDAVREFIRKVKAVFRGNKARQDSAAVQAYGVDMDTLEQAARLWGDALKATSKAVDAAQVQAQATEEEQRVELSKYGLEAGSTDGKETLRYSLKTDDDYLAAVQRGDMEIAQKLTKEAAERAGYTDVLYHGTQAFGFTEFDLGKSDDGITIFAAGSPELAGTYSGRTGTRGISDRAGIENLDLEGVVSALNREAQGDAMGMEYQYSLYTMEGTNRLIGEVNGEIENLRPTVEQKISEYADRMAQDFNDKDERTHRMLVGLSEALKQYAYDQISTPLYMLLHNTDAFPERADLDKLEADIRLMNALRKADVSKGAVAQQGLSGYTVQILSPESAKDLLKIKSAEGNYALYGRPGKQLVVDCEGRNWNNIPGGWKNAIAPTMEGTEVIEADGSYYLLNKENLHTIEGGVIEANEAVQRMTDKERHQFLLHKATSVLYVQTASVHSTRGIAKWAKNLGFDSVRFDNIMDNGGRAGDAEAGTVYTYFDPTRLKSAEPVVYDNNGDIIPLSERFNNNNPDIRFSLKTDSEGRELTSEQQEFFKDSKAVDRQGRLLTLYHQTEGLFTVFDPRHQGAGSRDDATPFGIFLKTSDRDIGLRGKFQMELYANIVNPLYARDREALTYSLLKLSDEYATIKAEIDTLDTTYHEKFERAKQELRDFITEWRSKNPDASRRALYDVPEFNVLYEAEDAVVDEWTQKANQLSTQAKNAITAALRNAGYDGIILSTDAGSFGRSTDAFIALDPEQVKNVSNKKPTSDPDIHYSVKKDNTGRSLTKAQRDYFAESKARDEQGRLLVLYHGTTAYGEITKFRHGKTGWLGPGIYLASKQSDAQHYADKMGPGNGQIYALYANITNPLMVTSDNPVPEILRAAYGRDSVYEARKKKQGNDTYIITPADIKKLQAKGYDGIMWTFAGGTEVSVFSPEQIKRVDNKAPTQDKDIRYSIKGRTYNRTAVLEEKTVDKYLADYAAKSSPRYAQAYIAYMDPSQFLDLTTSKVGRTLVEAQSRTLDASEFVDTTRHQPIQLTVDHKTGEVTGHEGRHRAVALLNSGVKQIPVLLFDSSNKYDKTPIQALTLTGQDFGMSRSDASVEVTDILPLSYENRDAILDRFTKAPTIEILAEKYQGKETLRYSLKGTRTIQEDVKALNEENEILRERLEYWKGQTKRTKRITTDKKAVAKAAKAIIQYAGSTLNAEDIQADLQSLYDFIASGYDGKEELTGDGVRERAHAIAQRLASTAWAVDDDLYREYADLRSYLRETRLNIGKEFNDITDFGDFRKRYFGKLRIGTKGTNIDQVYGELSGMWPEFFDEQKHSHPSDQLLHIAEVADMLYEVSESNPYSADMEQATAGITNEIIEQFFDLPQTKATMADRWAAKVEAAKQKGRSDVRKVRDQMTERVNAAKQAGKDAVQQQRLADDMFYGRKLAELRAQNQERVKRALRRQQETATRQMEAMKDRYAAKDQKGRERRSAAELRRKITRHSKALSDKLLHPTDKGHIPQELRGAVAAMLEAINQESAYTVDRESGKRTKGGTGDPTKRTEAFRALREQYEAISEGRTDFTGVLDPDLLDNLSAVIAMKDVRLADMTTTQLATVWQVVRAVEQSVSTANKLLGKSRFAGVKELAEGIRSSSDSRRTKGNWKGVVGWGDRLLNLDMMNPLTFFHQFGEGGDALYHELQTARDNKTRILAETVDRVQRVIGKTDINALRRETYTFHVEGGDITLTTAQIMSLYELAKREQAQDHIYKGGLRASPIDTGVDWGKSAAENVAAALGRLDAPAAGVRVSQGDVATILSTLTEEQVKIADGLQAIMQDYLAQEGNRESMKVYGYEKFTEDHYFPIASDPHQVQDKIGDVLESGEKRPRSVAEWGSAKATVTKANNGLLLGDIFDVFAQHAVDMATYASHLGAMEDMNRVRNFTFRDDEGNRTGTMGDIIQRVTGQGGGAYLNKLLQDVSAGTAKSNVTGLGKLTANYKAASVGANIRVALQQPTSYLRAAAVIDAKYLADPRAFKKGGWAKALKYAPIAQWKDWGNFEINQGRQIQNIMFNTDRKLEKARNAAMWLAGEMDSVTWGRIWNACELETMDTHPGLARGSEAFYEAVAQRFTDIIDQTQVVDNVLGRSQIMRSSDGLAKMATSYMGEPTQSYNLVYRAVRDLAQEQNSTKRTAARKVLGRAVTALAASQFVNAIAQALWDAVRDDDDRDKKYWERVLGQIPGNFVDNVNPVGMVPYVKDILSMLQGYDVKRMDMEAITSFISACQNMGKAINGEGRYTLAGAGANLLAETARIFGLPAATVKRDMLALARTVGVETGDWYFQYQLEKALNSVFYAGNRKEFYDIAWGALKDGEMDVYQTIVQDLMNQRVKAATIESAMRDRMKKAQEEDPGFTLGQKERDLIGSRDAYATPEAKEDTSGFTAADLSPTEYRRYNAQRSESYREVVDTLENFPTFRSLDGTVKDKALTAADKLTEALALEDHSGGAYTADTKWMLWAVGGGGAGVSEAEAILFKVAYDMAESNRDPETGKTISGSKKENTLEAVGEMMPWLTDKELSYLIGNYWKN